MEDPPKKFYRLAPGREVRLRYAYYIKCHKVLKDENGEITEIHCTYDPKTKGGYSPDGRKVRATLHWVSTDHALKAEARLYDRLFLRENPMDTEKEFTDYINQNSLTKLTCYVEPSLESAELDTHYQFERLGFFYIDSKDSSKQKMIFNRTMTLRDTWARMKKTSKKK